MFVYFLKNFWGYEQSKRNKDKSLRRLSGKAHRQPKESKSAVIKQYYLKSPQSERKGRIAKRFSGERPSARLSNMFFSRFIHFVA